MRNIFGRLAVATLAGLAGMTSANAINLVTYTLDTTVSNISDVRRIGAQSIPEVNQYTTHGGSLNPLDPKSWPILDKTYQTLPGAVTATYLSGSGCPNQCGTGATSIAGVPVAIEPNYSRISGSITVDLDTNTVTAATLTALDRLSLGAFQSDTTVNDLVVSDPTVNGHVSPFTATPLNLVTWTYNGAANGLGLLMSHQAGGGTAATSSNIAACKALALTGSSGAGFSGQCGQLAAAVNANGSTGQTTINNSWLNWTGVAANYVVTDATTVPWWDRTLKTLTISGAAGLPGITWDLSGFTGLNSTIKAYTTADSLSGNSAAGISATYTLQVVPVPAAVWPFGSALGLLGLARRRAS